MTRSGLGCLACIILLGPILTMPVVVFGAESLTLSHVRLVGTNRLSGDDVARGLDLKLGGATTRQQILHACDRFRKLRPFQSSHCRYHVEGQSLSLTISVEDKGAAPVVFDNFVWTTRGKLLTRLRHELPLFMPNLPIRTGLANDIIRVLQQVAAEHGIRAPVRYSTFWAGKGMNDFYVDGISTPIVSLRIEGENLPPPKQIQKWSNFCRTQNFSAAMLKWWTIQILDDLYHPRGYLCAAARNPSSSRCTKRVASIPYASSSRSLRAPFSHSSQSSSVDWLRFIQRHSSQSGNSNPVILTTRNTWGVLYPA